jgi:two-component system NtrC family sensor kinase
MVNQLAEEVNERTKAESELKKSRDYLGAMTSSMHDGLLVIEKDYTVSYANEAILSQSGLEMDDIIGQPCYKVSRLHDEDCHSNDKICRLDEVYRTKSPQITIHQQPDNNGNLKWVEVSMSPMFDEQGEVVRVVELFRDISERKRLEQEMLRAEKLASIGRLTAGACHEILNPLNIIAMRFYLMQNDPDTPSEIADHIKVLNDQVDRIYKITQGLVYFSRQQVPERKALNLNDEIRRVLSLMEHDLELRNIAVSLNLSHELTPIHADLDQLQQVILNLLTNARDAMPEEGSLVIGTDTVEKNGESYAEIRVEDTGVGIAPDHMEKLFEPFFSTKNEGESTGLGLSVCHGIVEAHGGLIHVESEEGAGTTFTVHLPLNLVPSIQQ